MATARTNVDDDASLLDEAFGLHDTPLAGCQRRRLGGLRRQGQANTGDGGATQNSREHGAAINCSHWFAPPGNRTFSRVSNKARSDTFSQRGGMPD